MRKAERNGLTTTEVDALGADARIREVARMLGGDPESEVSRHHARELLERATEEAHREGREGRKEKQKS